jgi:aryl carrier-like protein
LRDDLEREKAHLAFAKITETETLARWLDLLGLVKATTLVHSTITLEGID